MISDMIEWEKELLSKGVKFIAGIDEVGKGPLAGPLVVSAVILDIEKVLSLSEDVSDKNTYNKINDSKKLSDTKRRHIKQFLLDEIIDYSIVEMSPDYIDKKGISRAVQHAFFNSVKQLNTKPEHVLTDFVHIKNITRENQTNIVNGDSKSIIIAAASIIAKVYRDDIMIRMHSNYPEYAFHKHKGYGTKQHIAAIHKYGPCEIHRKSFEPIKSLLSGK